MSRPTPPRFVTRTLVATLGTMAFVLSAVFVVVTLSVRGQVRQSVVEKLDTGQRLLDKLEQQRLDTLQTQALDDRYASELSDLLGAHTLVVEDEAIRATTLPAETVAALTPGLLRTLGAGGLTTISDEEYAVRPLLDEGNAKVYVLGSVDASAGPLVAASLQRMGVIALGAFALAAAAGLWLARAAARPIDNLSASLAEMTRTRKFDRPLAASGASLEVDSLTDALNVMMASITSAQGETVRAHLEAIRAMAMALDARDPYTAGHSERVSALSVQIGRQMQLNDHRVEVLRLGALLHDIGKIGISDHLLRKPAPLTPDEYRIVKTHPAVGARILRHVRFLEPHLPIVELHHERPDGGGYPNGLKGSAVPLLARIVHVADAYDAMTSARAYRPALSQAVAMRELQRCAGTDFDPEAVQALAIVMSTTTAAASVAAIDEAFPAEVASPRAAAQPAAVTVDALDEFGCETPGA